MTKLKFLDKLKQNMGEEMTEQMSEEITKAMDEQRALEQRYAMLVKKRGELKGLSHKQELLETKEQIMVSDGSGSELAILRTEWLLVATLTPKPFATSIYKLIQNSNRVLIFVFSWYQRSLRTKLRTSADSSRTTRTWLATRTSSKSTKTSARL